MLRFSSFPVEFKQIICCASLLGLLLLLRGAVKFSLTQGTHKHRIRYVSNVHVEFGVHHVFPTDEGYVRHLILFNGFHVCEKYILCCYGYYQSVFVKGAPTCLLDSCR